MSHFISPGLPLLLLAAAFIQPLVAAPLITEFLASNFGGLADEDGARPDWIEIHNPDAAAVDLSGWTLTDNASLPARWTFPPVTLAPGGYLIVFASGKDRAVPGSPLHTNFSLTAGGEYLAMFPPGALTPSSAWSPAYPAQSVDVSYGLTGNAAGAPSAYFPTPTPGAPNVPSDAPAEAVVFSLRSRTFTSPATLAVSLYTASPTTAIYYTTNRTVPTTASTPYTGPVTVGASTRIRARAYEAGRPAGPVTSETYLMLDAAAAAFTSPLPIVLTHNFGSGTLANDAVVPASMMVFTPMPPDNLARLTDLPATATPVSLERRGSTTAAAPKHSMTLELWNETNEDRNLPLLGMPSDSDWVLHAPYEFDRSLIRNDLIYRLSNDAGRYASRTQFVEHFHNIDNAPGGMVNGAISATADYFGIYSLQERITRGDARVDIEKITPADNTVPAVQGGYLLKIDRRGTDVGIAAAGFSSGTGTLGPTWVDPKETSPRPDQVVTPAQKTWVVNNLNAMWDAMRAANFLDPVNGYAKFVDVVPTVDNHILNTAARNLDALRLSAYWHKPRYGKWTAGPLWDFDRAMGSADQRENSPVTWSGLATPATAGDFGTDFFHYTWYNEMFRNPDFWQQWVDRLDVMRQTSLSTAHVMAVIDGLSAPLAAGGASNPVSRNFQRWSAMPPRAATASAPGTNGTWPGEIAWLKTWWTQRLAFMDGQFMRPATSDLTPGVVPAGSTVGLTSPSTSTSGVKIYYTTDGTDPRPAATERYPQAGVTTVTTLMPETSSVRTIVPVADIGTSWQGLDLNNNGNPLDDFDDSLWRTNAPGTLNGVGYDDITTAGQTSFLPAIGVRLYTTANPAGAETPANTMRNHNASCYLRMPFTLTAAQIAAIAAPAVLTLEMRSDDGFVAFVNGVEVARDLAPAALAWNSNTAPNAAPFTDSMGNPLAPARVDSEALAWTRHPISGFAHLLKAGHNVLAIHGLNSSVTSNDALFAARIVLLTPPPPYMPPVAASAQLYPDRITISGPVVITSRTLSPNLPSDPPTTAGGGTGAVPNGTGWSAPRRDVYLPGTVPANSGNLAITEILYHPGPPSAAELAAGYLQANDFEFIRLTNTGSQPLNLTGLRFSAGIAFTQALDISSHLPVGGSVVIVENRKAFVMRYGNLWPILGEFSGTLDDAGETLVLVDANSLAIADLTYDDAAPWPVDADAGKSLIYTGGNPANSFNWRASLDIGGSGVTSFVSFQKRYYPAGGADAAANADPDGDGLSNFAEYAMGTHPGRSGIIGAAPLTIVSATPLRLRVQRRMSLPNATWGLEAGGSLTSWQTLDINPVIAPLTPDLETLTWEPPAAAPPLFFRVKVAIP